MTIPSPTSPAGIALKRFLETGAIVLVAALLVALPRLQAQLTVCAEAIGATGPVVSCQIGWGVILASFASAIIAGALNALTAFLSSLHNIVVGPTVTTTTPIMTAGAVVGATVTSIETKGVQVK